jgi:hypothetical protein
VVADPIRPILSSPLRVNQIDPSGPPVITLGREPTASKSKRSPDS